MNAHDECMYVYIFKVLIWICGCGLVVLHSSSMGKALGLILGYLYLCLSPVIYIILGVIMKISRIQLLTHQTLLIFFGIAFKKHRATSQGVLAPCLIALTKRPIKQLKQGRKVSVGRCRCLASQAVHGTGAGGN